MFTKIGSRCFTHVFMWNGSLSSRSITQCHWNQSFKRSQTFCKRRFGVALGLAGLAVNAACHGRIPSKNEGADGDANLLSNVSDFMAKTITDIAKLSSSQDDMRTKMELFIMKVQSDLCKALQHEENQGTKEVFGEEEKPVVFRVDRWERGRVKDEVSLRESSGGGISCIMQDGVVFEKAGVNVSVVHGKLPLAAAAQMRARGKPLKEGDINFFAAGISCVIHPRNPFVPTLHFNYRYFEAIQSDGSSEWWFAGGTDLTPYYVNEADFKHFHSEIKNACDKYDKSYYSSFKKWCDDYFYIRHRGEHRGVGGIFFDDLDLPSKPEVFEFIKACSNAVIPSYMPLVQRNRNKGYGYAERQWQLLRRGRYAEFNLIYDRGTKFGLMTPEARVESIFMSLPLVARWEYMHSPPDKSSESDLLEILRNPKDWV